MTRAGWLLVLLLTSGCFASTPLQLQVSPAQVALVDAASGDTLANGTGGEITVDLAGRDDLEGRLVCAPFDDLPIHVKWTSADGWMLLSEGPPQPVKAMPPLCLSRTIHLNVSPADSTVYETVDDGAPDTTVDVAGVTYEVRTLPHGSEGYHVPHGWSPPTLVLVHAGFRPRLWVIPSGALATPEPVYPAVPIDLSPRYGPFSYPGVDVLVLMAVLVGGVFWARGRQARRAVLQARQQVLDRVLSPTGQQDDDVLASETGQRYRLAERLGQGGMGSVWVGVSEGRGERVALKLLLPASVADAESVQRFLREVRICAQFNHPAIVKVLDWGTWRTEAGQQAPFTVLELVEGKTLRQVRETEGPRIDEARVVGWLTDTLQGLQIAHDASIIHRDIKPDNLMLTSSGHVKILDFGIAHICGATVTATGTILGTPRYMAPEQFDAREVVPATDIHALGLVAYELLSGNSALPADEPFAAMGRLFMDDIPPIHWAVPGLSSRVADVVTRMMAPAVEDRYATCQQVLQALRGS